MNRLVLGVLIMFPFGLVNCAAENDFAGGRTTRANKNQSYSDNVEESSGNLKIVSTPATSHGAGRQAR